ncbi:major latex protein 15-like isoform X2 [Cucurbita maxima]|uniref:Major latex protein 15-like isoform X2 n=1 Tax=Cucurbita maxima TaxID=3661 RepID=A0A6J1KD93_CUCMA|nr:major latex protein 15-like isoform X2 [Cucurbita maxima]
MMSPQNKMSRTDSIWVKVPLKSSPEKYYGFFRNHMGDLVNLFPQYYSSIQLVEGANFSPDCIIQFKYSLGGRSLSANVKIKTVDDAKKLLAYNIIEGDVLKHYKVFEVRMEVVNGGTSKGGGGSFAKWSVVFEKANENVAAPEDYLEWFVKICKGVDAYFSKN